MELDFSPRPPPPPTPEPDPPQPTLPAQGDIDAMLGAVVRLLTEVVGETVRQSIDTAVERLEQAHARERNALVERFDAALERQDSRLRTILEHQAQQHAKELRAILQDTLVQHPAAPITTPPAETTAVLDELQETLRLGFGEVRGALDRHHKELIAMRAELRPIAQAALTHLHRPEPPTPITTNETRAPATPPPRASPPRAPPARDADASSRLDAAIHDGNPEDTDDIEDREDPPRRSLHYRPPADDDSQRTHHQEASP